MSAPMDRDAIVELMESRLHWVRDEAARAAGGANALSGATHLQSIANELHRLQASEHELQILLRAAAGMNPNGRWPHPDGRCIHCGRHLSAEHDEGSRVCILCRRKGLD